MYALTFRSSKDKYEGTKQIMHDDDEYHDYSISKEPNPLPPASAFRQCVCMFCFGMEYEMTAIRARRKKKTVLRAKRPGGLSRIRLRHDDDDDDGFLRFMFPLPRSAAVMFSVRMMAPSSFLFLGREKGERCRINLSESMGGHFTHCATISFFFSIGYLCRSITVCFLSCADDNNGDRWRHSSTRVFLWFLLAHLFTIRLLLLIILSVSHLASCVSKSCTRSSNVLIDIGLYCANNALYGSSAFSRATSWLTPLMYTFASDAQSISVWILAWRSMISGLMWKSSSRKFILLASPISRGGKQVGVSWILACLFF